jgi:lambda repressor-like predicted transcriptional regulator
VEAIGRNSNLGHLCKKWAGLRKSIDESLPQPLLSQPNGPKPRAKRFLTADAVTDIVRRYGGGETTQQISNRYGISKSCVAKVLREQGVAIRRQGLNDEQENEAAGLHVAGHSLAWLGSRYGVAHTTIATALRRQGVLLRPRPGWT